jgi:ATP-dependent Lon protease
METFETKALEVFNDILINKSLVHKAGFGSRAIPTYVREWIISHYLAGELDLSNSSREKIAQFVGKHVPDKSEKETIKNKLFEQIEVKFLDNLAVYVNLAKGDRYLHIPFLDEHTGYISPHIIQENEMLLSSGLWGLGSFFYIPPSGGNERGQVWLHEFHPFQLANIDIGYFTDSRSKFSTNEWIDLIVSSMGFNHKIYNERQKILLISRLIPLVEPRYNLVELAPKGTGKSFVYENMSRYVAVRAGSITPAVLFFNDARKTPGLITRYDCVVIDEAQKVKGDSSGELTALLKSYLEAGRFGRGSADSIAAEAGIVILANIELDHNKRPIHEDIGLFKIFPNFLRETAFIDRFSGLLPGWYLPRISKQTPSQSLGLKGDIFGEIMHSLRFDISFGNYIKSNTELLNCDDMRDSRGIEAGATGLLKLLFPDKQPSEPDFYKYCVNPALEMRQRVRDELTKLDREYQAISMKSKYPDEFQKTHRAVSFVAADIDTESFKFNDEKLDEEVNLLEFFAEDEQTEVPTEEPASEKTLHISEGETGHSFQTLFGPYLIGAKSIYLTDPYIRLEFQIRNFLAFTGIISTADGPMKLHLTTGAEDEYQKRVNSQKFDEIAASLAGHGITFTYEFSDTIHRRGIELDNGWRIIIDRGLDMFQKPESRYELSEVDQAKKKCRETEMVYMREDNVPRSTH